MTRIEDVPGFKEIMDSIMKARKEGISINFMMEMTKEGTKFFNVGTKVLRDEDSFDIVTVMIMFHVSVERTKEIIIYIKKLMKDYNGSVADVLRDINHNIIGHEKYFAAYIIGKNFGDTTTEEQFKIVSDTLQELDIERFKETTDFVENVLKEEAVNPKIYPPNSLKKIMEGNFEENEKVFMVFTYGLT